MRLHKFTSNSKEVIAKIAPDDRAKGVKDLDLHNDVLPIERAWVFSGAWSQTPLNFVSSCKTNP